MQVFRPAILLKRDSSTSVFLWNMQKILRTPILNNICEQLLLCINKRCRVFTFRSSHRRCSVRKGTLRNFTKFTGKHLCQSLCFNKACNFIKIEFMAMVFSCEFCEISMNTFFTEHVWVTASTLSLKRQKSLCKHKL